MIVMTALAFLFAKIHESPPNPRKLTCFVIRLISFIFPEISSGSGFVQIYDDLISHIDKILLPVTLTSKPTKLVRQIASFWIHGSITNKLRKLYFIIDLSSCLAQPLEKAKLSQSDLLSILSIDEKKKLSLKSVKIFSCEDY